MRSSLTPICLRCIGSVMRLVSVRQSQVVSRMVAWVLLAGVFVLTSAPVCSCFLDIHPAACCNRHARPQAPSTCDHQDGAKHGHSQKACCSRSAGSGCNANLCCEQGRLNYPSVKVQASASSTLASHVVMAVPAVRLPAVSPEARRVSPELILKTPSRALYTLTATYRI
jgi:hypothetical protein